MKARLKPLSVDEECLCHCHQQKLTKSLETIKFEFCFALAILKSESVPSPQGKINSKE